MFIFFEDRPKFFNDVVVYRLSAGSKQIKKKHDGRQKNKHLVVRETNL